MEQKKLQEELFLKEKNEQKETRKIKSKKEKKEKGITLIALVITIIILLILAGVTLNAAIRRKWINKKGEGSKRSL